MGRPPFVRALPPKYSTSMRLTVSSRVCLTLAVSSLCLTAPAKAQGTDWSNAGGNAQRNGATLVFGPDAPDLLWSTTADPSIIAWHAASSAGVIATVRQTGFPGATPGDEIVAYDEDTGAEAWRTTLPYGGDSTQEWTAWVGGSANGRIICGRGGSGRETPLYALDPADGSILWTTTDLVGTSGYDGVNFTADGDVIAADNTQIFCFDGATGQRVWRTVRNCAVSGSCGAAVFGDAIYIDEVGPGGQVITRIDAATGAKLYSSGVMSGFTSQNAPFVSRDGSHVYYARTQNNPAVDELYAFLDDGTQLTGAWSRPVAWTTNHDHGIGPDGTIYTFLPGDEFVGLDPSDGSVRHTAGVLAPLGGSPRTAIAIDGTVYLSNGWASSPATDGRLWAFTPDLTTQLFSLNLDRQNAGGPFLFDQGQLVLADRTGLFAYRRPGPDATCAPRAGSGANPATITCLAPPRLYGQFAVQIDIDADTAVTLTVIGAPIAPLPILGGELMVNVGPGSFLTFLPASANGVHTFGVGGAPSLFGLSATVQGARLQVVGGVVTAEYTDAVDFTVGY